MAADPSGIVRWGVFEFDPSTGTLSKHGREVRLAEQPSMALGLLLARAGELVSREEMRAALWPDGTFVDFENGINVAINRIRDALGDSATSPRFIETVPRRGHRFIAPVVRSAMAPIVVPAPVAAPPLPRRPWGVLAAAAAAATLMVGVLAVVAARRTQPTASETLARAVNGVPHLTRLTSFPGVEMCPALSPDGEQVAFTWALSGSEHAHVYVTMVGSAERRQITGGDGVDSHPAWSSDGRHIAFVRRSADGSHLYVVSALGGPPRRIGDFPAGGQVAWWPGDQYLLAGRSEGPEKGIWAVPLDGGTPRLIVSAPPGGGARGVALSPDRRRMAFASCRNGYLDCDADVVPLDASLAPTAAPVAVVRMSSLGGFSWTRDGRVLVFFCDPNGNDESRLCRVDVDSRKLETIDAAGLTVGIPTTTHANDRLVFVRFENDANLAAARAGRDPMPVAVSSADEGAPSFAPDGRQIAFVSARTGPREIWIADASGANPRQLTHGPGPVQGVPRWSPDGRLVAFESRAPDGHVHVWVIGSEGSPLRPLTEGIGDEGAPSWSADGHYVYFGANEGGGYDIWRVPVAGGIRERLTTQGSGYVAFEAPDGRGFLYQQTTEPSAVVLERKPGGPTTVIVPCAEVSAFAVQRKALYYVPCGQAEPVAVRRVLPTRGGDARVVTLDGLDRDRPGELAVSPDGKTILYVRAGNEARGDLWMIDPFH